MTGEMFSSDLTPETYPLHFAIAKALGGEVKPFDVYQGPYVVIGPDHRAGDEPYAYCPRGLGIVRLWITDDDEAGGTVVYNEDTEAKSTPFWPYGAGAEEAAVEAAWEVVGEAAESPPQPSTASAGLGSRPRRRGEGRSPLLPPSAHRSTT